MSLTGKVVKTLENGDILKTSQGFAWQMADVYDNQVFASKDGFSSSKEATDAYFVAVCNYFLGAIVRDNSKEEKVHLGKLVDKNGPNYFEEAS